MKLWGGVVRVLLGCALSGSLMAQTLVQTQDADNPIPSEALVGEQFCYEVELTNPTSNAGYAPYYRMSLPEGLTFASATLTPSLATSTATQTFPASSPFQVADPVIGDVVTGTVGGQFVSMQLPIGSFVGGGPKLELNVCLTIDPNATVNTPLNFSSQTAYVFGDSATGKAGLPPDGDTILSTAENHSVTPVVAVFLDKRSTTPEGEMVPGQPYQYIITLDVADGKTVGNASLTDSLPAELILLGQPTATGGSGCTITPSASATFPMTGGVSVGVTCASVTGTTANNDLVLTVPVEVADVLEENACELRNIDNNANFSGQYPPNASTPLSLSGTQNNRVESEHFHIQRSSSIATGALPGSTVTQTLTYQVSDYAVIAGGAGVLTITDTIADGLDVDVGSLLIDGVSPAASVVTTTLNANGTTTVVIDLGAHVGAAGLPAGSSGTITYDTTILENYRATTGPLDGQPVRGLDSFSNSVVATYRTTEGATGCSEESSNTIEISGYQLTKVLKNAQTRYQVGEPVEFQITAVIPSGELTNVVWTDYLPLPVLNALEHGASPTVSATETPGVCDIEVGASTTSGYGPPTVTAAGAAPPASPAAPNSLVMDWGNITSNPTQSVTLQLNICFTMLGERFTDELDLTNQVTSTADGNTQTNQAATSASLFKPIAPNLDITKRIIASSNSNASIDIIGNLTNADAGDEITYQVELRNRGRGRAFDVQLSETVPAGLTNCGLRATNPVTYGDGTTAAGYAGDLFASPSTFELADTNPNPTTTLGGGNGAIAGRLDGGAQDSHIVLVHYVCTVASDVQPVQTITNTVTLSNWSSGEGGPSYPSKDDEAQFRTADMALAKTVVPGSITPSAADVGLGADGNINDEWVIGSTARYRVTATLPEGQQDQVIIRDFVNSGLAIIGCESFTTSPNVTITPPNNFAALDANCSNIGTTAGVSNPRILPSGSAAYRAARRADFNLGTVTVAPSANSTQGTITIEYTVLLLDTPVNLNGRNRRNSVRWRRANRQIKRTSAPRIRIREPRMTATKTFTPDDGDAGTDSVLSIRLVANGGANRPNPFDVKLTDLIDTSKLDVTGPPTVTNCPDTPDVGPTYTAATGLLEASWTVFNKGTVCTINLPVKAPDAASIGTDIENTAQIAYSSMPQGDVGTAADPDANEHTNLGNSYILGENTPGDQIDSERTTIITASDTFTVARVEIDKVVASRSETTGSSFGQSSNQDVTVGEIIEYDMVAIIPDGVAENVVITDQAITSTAKLELLEIVPNSIVIGGDIRDTSGTTAIPAPNPYPTPIDSNADGINDRVIVSLGNIRNIQDNVNTPTINNQVRFRVRARVLADNNTPATNAQDDVLTNMVSLSSDTFATVSHTNRVDVVEPSLAVSKNGPANTNNFKAGDTVTFTIVLTHAPTSQADAHIINVVDQLPADFTLVTPNISDFSAVAGRTCSVSASAITKTPDLANNRITVTTPIIPRGEACQFTYDAVVDANAQLGSTISNNVALNYRSTDDAESAEDFRNYSDNASYDLTLSRPGLVKVFVGSNDNDSPDIDGVLGVEPDITLGEVARYRLTLNVEPGTIENAVIRDQLPWSGDSPTAAQFEFVSAEITRIGSNITNTNGLTVDSSSNNDIGKPNITTTDTAPTDGVPDTVAFDFGNITNAGSTTEQIVIVVRARPTNNALNHDKDNATNTGQLTWDIAGVAQEPLTSVVNVDLVRPVLSLSKTPDVLADQDANDRITFTLTLENTGTATAYDVTITDVLPDPGSRGAENFSYSNCLGSPTVNDSPLDKSISIVIEDIVAGQTVANGNACVITYDVIVDANVVSTTTYTNTAQAVYHSLNNDTGNAFRQITEQDSGSFSIGRPEITKSVVSSSNPDLGSIQGSASLADVAIGDEICYHSTITVPEGIIQDLVFTDVMPSGRSGEQGVIAVTSASLVSAGENGSISYTGSGSPDTPFLDDSGNGHADTARFAMGTVENKTTDNTVTDADRIVIEVCGVVKNLGPSAPNAISTNEQNDVLTNTATIAYTGSNNQTISSSDTASVDVVEPILTVTKSMPQVVDDVATIQISVENTGEAPAYELVLSDTLSATNFKLNTIAQDTIPAGFEFAATAAGVVTLSNTSTATAAQNAVMPGETVSFTFTVEVADNADLTQAISNTANASATTMPGTNADERTVTGSDTVNLNFPLLAATKVDALQIDADSSGTGNVTGGDIIRYTITVNNTGTTAATNVIVSDVISDANLMLVAGSVTTTGGGTATVNTGNTTSPADTNVNVTFSSIAAGDSATVVFDAVVASPLPLGVTEVGNQAIIASDQQSDFSSDDPDDAESDTSGTPDVTSTPLTRRADLSVEKTASTANVVPGTPITFTIVVTNNGADHLDDGAVADILPTALLNPTWSCFASSGSSCTSSGSGNITDNPVTILKDGTLTYTVTGVIDPTASGTLSNTAKVDTSTTVDPVSSNDSDDVSVTLNPNADVSVSKTTPTTSVNAGDAITYTVSVRNGGPSTAMNVRLTDPTPNGTTVTSIGAPCASGFPCNLGNLATGDVVNVTVTLTLDSPYNGPSDVFNQATVQSSTPDLNSSNNADSVTTPVGRAPEADLALSKTAPASAAAGGNVTYTLTATNQGPNDASNVVIRDDVPAGLTFVSGSPGCALSGGSVTCTVSSLSVNGSHQVQLTFAIPSGYAGADPILNTASVSSDTTDPNTSNNGASASVALGNNTVDLSLDKTGPATITDPSSGTQTISYTLLVSNVGGADATGVRVTDAVPAGLTYRDADSDATCNLAGSNVECVIGDLSAGAVRNLTVMFDVPNIYSGANPIVNTANVSSTEADSNPSNNQDTVPTSFGNVQPSVDLSIGKTGPSSVPGSSRITYTLVVNNNSGNSASNVVVTDDIPAQLVYVDVSSDARCNEVSSTVQCTIPSITGGSAENLQLVFDVPNSYVLPNPATNITNTASVISDNPDSDPSNNSDTHQVPPPAASAEVFKDAVISNDADNSGGTLTPGDSVTYTVTIENTSQVAITNARYLDTPDANSVLQNATLTTSQGTITTGSTAGDTSIDIAIGQINGGDTVTVTYTVIVNNPLPAGVTQIRNQGTLSATEIADEPSDDPDTTDPSEEDDPTILPIDANPELVLAKVDAVVIDNTPTGANSGDTIEYTITATNNGNRNVDNAIIADTPGANTTLVAGSVTTTAGTVTRGNGGSDSDVAVNLGTLAGGGGTATVTFRVTVDQPLPLGVTQVSNQALLDGTVLGQPITQQPSNDPDTADPSDGTITPVIRVADLSVTKTAAPSPVEPGQTLTYTITVTNNGPDPVDDATVTDNVPAGLANPTWTCAASTGSTCTASGMGDINDTPVTIANGGTLTYTLQVQVETTVVGTNLVNTVNVSSANAIDTDTTNNSASETTPLSKRPEIRLYKQAQPVEDTNGNGRTDAGDRISYAFTVRNTGNVTVTGLAISDAKISSISCVATVLAPNAETTCTGAAYVITQADMDAGYVENTATANATDPDGGGVQDVSDAGDDTAETPDGNNASDGDPTNDPTVVGLSQNGAIQLYKQVASINDANGNGYNDAGDTMSYTFTVTNTGTVTLNSIAVTDSKVANITCAATSLAPTASTQCSGDDYVITADDMSRGYVQNTATVLATDPDGAQVRDTSDAGDDTQETPDGTNGTDGDPTDDPTTTPRLSIVKTGPDKYFPGRDMTFNITVTNHGPGVSTNTMLLDPAPAGLSFERASGACTAIPCNLGDLNVGESRQLTLVFKVAAAYQGPKEIINTAIVTSDASLSASAASAAAQLGRIGAELIPANSRVTLWLLIFLVGVVGVRFVRRP